MTESLADSNIEVDQIMANFEKPLRDFTEEELQQKTNQCDPKFGALALYELQRRQQEKNTIQISILTKEIIKFKNITDKNTEASTKISRDSNILAKYAIYIALAAFVAQVIFSIHQKSGCVWSTVSVNDPNIHYSGCYRSFDFGLFGEYTFSRPDR